jgi:predicted nucleic acid-binding protein
VTVAFDNTFLTLLLDPSSDVRSNPATGSPTLYMPARLETLIDELTKRGDKLIIPAPAIAEVMCKVSPPTDVMARLNSYKCIEPYAFDQKCALTLGEISQRFGPAIREARALNEWARQRVKVDIQIVAVAVTYGADTLYTDDDSQATFAEICGLNVMHSWNLPISDEHRQADLFEGDANGAISSATE